MIRIITLSILLTLAMVGWAACGNGPAEAPRLVLEVGADTTWQDVFDSATETEQECLLSIAGDNLERPFYRSVEHPPLDAGVIYSCLNDETALAVYVGMTVLTFAETGTPYGEGEIKCLTNRFSQAGISSLVSGGREGTAGFLKGLSTCAPRRYLSRWLRPTACIWMK